MPAVVFFPMTRDNDGNKVYYQLPKALIAAINEAVFINKQRAMAWAQEQGNSPITFEPEYKHYPASKNDAGVPTPEDAGIRFKLDSIQGLPDLTEYLETIQEAMDKLAKGGVYPRLGGKSWSDVAQKAEHAQKYMMGRLYWDLTWGSEVGAYIRGFGEPDSFTFHKEIPHGNSVVTLGYEDEPFRVLAMMGQGGVEDEEPLYSDK